LFVSVFNPGSRFENCPVTATDIEFPEAPGVAVESDTALSVDELQAVTVRAAADMITAIIFFVSIFLISFC
jgi:hypothetical protein